MRNLLLTLMFDGTAYHGWQVQENALTVQEVLQNTLEKILSERVPVAGCGRTDSGVHAENFCCNFHTQSSIAPEKLKKALNAVLPRDIAVRGCSEVMSAFHARYDCTSKAYKYLILNTDYRNPFYENRALFHPYRLDEAFLSREAGSFLGRHDFSAFCASGSSVEDRVREVTAAEVRRRGDLVEFRFEANGFLYNMVRIMVGTLLDVSAGKLGEGAIPKIIAGRDRSSAGATAPPCGLYLTEVRYDTRKAGAVHGKH